MPSNLVNKCSLSDKYWLCMCIILLTFIRVAMPLTNKELIEIDKKFKSYEDISSCLICCKTFVSSSHLASARRHVRKHELLEKAASNRSRSPSPVPASPSGMHCRVKFRLSKIKEIESSNWSSHRFRFYPSNAADDSIIIEDDTGVSSPTQEL